MDRDTAHWAVGGFSFGGTCALQLAVAHPTLFPTFLDISGQVEPTLGSTDRTISQAFGGSEKAYRAAMPLSVLAADQADPARAPVLHQMVAIFAVGTHDDRFSAAQRAVMAQCEHAGMQVHWIAEPGGHSWYVASAALTDALPRLATRMGIT